MSDLHYYQYAFARPECRVQEIGSGVDPHYNVELICEGEIAAVTSRVSLDQFDPEKLQGTTADDIQWLRKIAIRHNEIICQAAGSSAVLPLRLSTVFRSLDALRTMLVQCHATVAKFLEQLGNRQEWGVKLYLKKRRVEPLPGHHGPPRPHYLGPPQSGTAHLAQEKAHLDGHRESQTKVHQTIQSVEQCLTDKAEHCRRIHNLPSHLTGRTEEMVFNAAFLLSSSEQAKWLEAVQNIYRDVHDKGLVLEITGPWPPYHFCPALEL